MRDTKSYCGILLDDNNRKPICRLRFNYSQKYLALLDADKNEQRIAIDAPTDLYKHADALLRSAHFHDGQVDSPRVESSEDSGDASSD